VVDVGTFAKEKIKRKAKIRNRKKSREKAEKIKVAEQ
jgi:hypothetical protein